MSASAARLRAFAILVPICSTALCLLALEIGLRVAIFSDTFGVAKVQEPRHYADPWLDDDYWKLRFMLMDSRNSSSGVEPGQVKYAMHAQLGWAPKVTEENPRGIVTDRPDEAAELGSPVLFFGDSYVDGPEPMPNKLPQLLDPRVPERRVLNYGVSGYGVDQIYLRFLDTLGQYDHPIVLIGIQDRDLDRSILTFRGGQKPLLNIENGELVVGNLPIRDAATFVAENPIELDSYLLRLILLRVRMLGAEAWVDRMLGYDQRQEFKLRLNRRILEALKERAVASGIRLHVVLFYVQNDMYEVNWREVFLKDTLEELGIQYFDTKTYLLNLVAARGGAVGDYWDDQHGHPNREGNLAFAEGIAAWLEDLEAVPAQLSSSVPAR